MAEPYTNAYRRFNYGSAARYDEDGYRRSDGRRKIQGYRQSQGPVRTYGGLNEYYALQDRNTRAFADPRFPGKSAGEISQNAQSMGQQINRYGQAEDAYSNRFRVNAPQRGATREGNIVDRPARATTAETKTPPRESIDDTPKAAAARARASGPLGKLPSNQPAGKPTGTIRPPAPKATEETPPRASEIVTSAQRREMLRDATAGRSDTVEGGKITRISSKYGTASTGVPVNDPKRVGMVRDDFGNMVPIQRYNERRRYVESTRKDYTPSRRA